MKLPPNQESISSKIISNSKKFHRNLKEWKFFPRYRQIDSSKKKALYSKHRKAWIVSPWYVVLNNHFYAVCAIVMKTFSMMYRLSKILNSTLLILDNIAKASFILFQTKKPTSYRYGLSGLPKQQIYLQCIWWLLLASQSIY